MKKSIVKATGTVFILSLLAKIIGFVKSMIEASFFGTSLEMDAYNVTSGFVSNILYMLTTAIAVAFVPIYIQHKVEENERKKFATRAITSLSIISIVIIGILVILAPIIVKVIAPSFDFNERSLAINYFRVLSSGIVFSLMANMFVSILNAEKRYGFSTLSSIINSIVLITFIILFSKIIGVWALVLAMPVTFIIQWCTLYLVGHRYATISLKYGLKDDSLRVLVLQAAPILLSQATVEINQVVDRALLSGVEVGALTAVSYSAVLYQFVTTIISTPLSTVMFTELSEAGADQDKQRIKFILESSFRVLAVICIPIMVITLFCSTDIVTFIYGHGRFTGKAIIQCAAGLQMYVLCLLPVSVKSVLSRAYYGLNDTKRPMIFGIMEVALNIVLSIILVRFYGIRGVVGATAIASYVFIVVLVINFNTHYVKIISKDIIIPYWKMMLGLVVVVLSFIFINPLIQFPAMIDFITKAIIGFIIYYAVLLITKEETVIQFLTMITQFQRRKKK